MRCRDLHLTDNAVVIEITNFRHPVVWDFAAGWYALGPERPFPIVYHQRMVVGCGTVIETSISNDILVWSIAESELSAQPIIDGGSFTLWQVMPLFFNAPFKQDYHQLEVQPDEVHDTSEALSAQHHVHFDLIYRQGGYAAIPPDPFTLYGSRYTLSIAQDDHLDATPISRYTLRRRTNFHLPPMQGAHLASHGPPAFPYTRGLMVSRAGCERHAAFLWKGLCMYSLASPSKGTLTERNLMGGKGSEEQEVKSISNDVPVEAALTCLVGVHTTPDMGVCMASGRVYGGRSGVEGRRAVSFVSDFLPPWND
ncbi:hypothetical protein FA13DRAFT_1287742 [Coprinellus micaceus]|uniref:Uncharacterized protein n=1 Tax=Coprinellus micaceus TaxID=71717 RepID=A0A4Y7SSH4_COPMI|nr:hypothetical protein FA13DRAFT_1287742 [Coprinellus micaceus]